MQGCCHMRGHTAYMVEWVGMVVGRYVTDVQGRRSDGGHKVVQRALGDGVLPPPPRMCAPPCQV